MKNNLKQDENGEEIGIIETKNEFVKNTCENIIDKDKLKKWIKWTSDEIETLIQLSENNYHDYQILQILHRSVVSVTCKREKLGLLKRRIKISTWNDEEKSKLKNLIDDKIPMWKISKILNKTKKSIQYKAFTLGILTNTHEKKLEKRKFIEKYGNTDLSKMIIKRFSAAKSRSKIENIEFNITRDFLIELYYSQNGMCYYSNKKMNTTIKNRNRNNTDPYSISIDRLDSLKGYTEDNIVLCCNIVNLMKNGLTKPEFIEICNKISNKFKKFPNDIPANQSSF